MEFRVTGGDKNGEGEGGLGEEKTQGSIPGSGRSPGGGNGNPLQYFCLENPQNRGAQQTTVPWGRKELDMNERLRKPKKKMREHWTWSRQSWVAATSCTSLYKSRSLSACFVRCKQAKRIG